MTAPRQFTLAIFVVAGACVSGCGGGTLDGGTGGTAGAGTGAVGGQSGGAGGIGGQSGGAGGIGGQSGGAGGNRRGGRGGRRTRSAHRRARDPWPSSCVTVSLDRPASAASLTGPNPNSGFGDPPLPGEFIAAKLNGLARMFSTSLTVQVTDDGAMRRFWPRWMAPTAPCTWLFPTAGQAATRARLQASATRM